MSTGAAVRWMPVALRKTSGEFGFGAGGHRLGGLKAAPVSGDLGEEFLARGLLARAVPRDGVFEHLAGLVVLAAVEKNLGELVTRRIDLIKNRSVKRDEMVLRRKLEAADTVGGFGKALILGESVHFEDSLGAVRILPSPPTVAGKGLLTELIARKPASWRVT
jgi:hypothetical protein